MRRPNLKSYHYRFSQTGFHSFHEYQFTCAICERDVRDTWDRNPRDRSQWPLCGSCERTWGSKIPNMTGLDRRNLAQLKALSYALDCEAAQIDHRGAL